eukprot:5449731-Amphidinium_carterae.1
MASQNLRWLSDWPKHLATLLVIVYAVVVTRAFKRLILSWCETQLSPTQSGAYYCQVVASDALFLLACVINVDLKWSLKVE